MEGWSRWGGATCQEQQAGDPNSCSIRQQQQRAPCSSGHQQQQRTARPAPPSVSPRAAHALELYSECVAAGQHVRLTLEQRKGGEYISLQISPPAGKRRPPNQGRTSQQAARKAARQQQRKQQQPGTTSSVDKQPSPPTRDSAAVAAPTTPTRSYAAVVASPQQQKGTSVDSTPRLTRAMKKRKAECSPATASPPPGSLPQLDGAQSPPPTPPPPGLSTY